MGRPKLDIPRIRQFNVALTASEFADVERAARLAGMRPVDYGRAKLLLKPPRLTRGAYSVQPVDPALLLHLSRLGNNLNQIARALHELSLPTPEELNALLAEIRAVLRAAQSP
jgi:hypothetical protein